MKMKTEKWMDATIACYFENQAMRESMTLGEFLVMAIREVSPDPILDFLSERNTK